MADGKNKRLTKGGKKGEKKIVEDKKKEDTVKAPDMFIVPDLGETRTQETRIDSDLVFEVNLADLNLNDKVAFRKFKLITEDVQGENCLTNFHGMDLTRNQMCSIVKCSIVKCFIKDKKRQTPFETRVDVKTTDGYLVRLFCDGFLASPRYLGTTKIVKPQQAQHRQIRQIRQMHNRMHNRMHKKIRTPEVQTDDLEVVQVIKLVPYSVGKDMEEAFQKGYPDVCVRKVQMLNEPEFELGKPMELHGGGSAVKATGDETGVKVERADGYEPPIQETV